MAEIPEQWRDLLDDDAKAFFYLGTVMADGTPQVTPVWFSYDGEYVWINSAKGRVKDRNMRARPQVAGAFADPQDPYRYMQIRGEIVEITEDGAADHIRDLALKYRGKREFEIGGKTRVIYKIRPDKVSGMG